MDIRPAVASDIEFISRVIVPLVEKYILPTCSHSGGNILKDSMSKQRIQEYYDSGCRYLVGTDNGVIIAVIGMRNNSHLYHLFVADSHKGKGCAKALWEYAKCECIEQYATHKFTVNSALNAASMYEKWGFKAVTGVREHLGIKDVPMQLLLRAD